MNPLVLEKKLPSIFVLTYPFTSQIFCKNNGIMQRFTYREKNRDDRLKYNGINFTSRKNGSNFRKSENPNRCVFDSLSLLFNEVFKTVSRVLSTYLSLVLIDPC